MKKIISLLLSFGLLLGVVACASTETTPASQAPAQTTTEQGSNETTAGGTDETPAPSTGDGLTIEGEIENGRFLETRSITVEIYDRGNDGGSTPEDNVWTDFIKEGMLRDHNVEVTFIPVPRWTEVEQLNNLLAAGQAPDVSLTYDYPTILTYANMGGVTDLGEYVETYKDALPNLWGWLGETNIYWDRNPEDGTLWAIEAKLANNTRINTFVRQDWLETLNLDKPTTTQEFEDMLIAFRDNAELLLGADASQMVPFSVSYDVGWRSDHLISSFIPEDISERDYWLHGFDDRKFLQPGIKDGIQLLNKWYNMDLLWDDFALYGPGDTTEDNMMKAGYVGSFMHNWDYPYRNGEDSINASLQRLVGENANYVTIEPFENAAGVHRKFLPGPVDRKVFFPSTNDEVLASLLYLDWISTVENRMYLQIGVEGTNHILHDNGAVESLAATGDWIMNSPLNIDYTITINGLNLNDPERTANSIAFSYPGVDPEIITTAFEMSTHEGRISRNVNVGEITSEAGMGPALSEKRDVVLNQALVASEADFDSVFDAGMQDYLNSGGQAIIEERTAKWEAMYGSATEMP